MSGYRITDVSLSQDALAPFRRVYETIYTAEFPDADERESRENMEEYLRLKAEGWYGANNYHILLVVDESGTAAGGVVADYLERSNTGVIEFLVVDPARRGQGLGRLLLDAITARFMADAERAGHEQLGGICGEVNDPYRRCDVHDHLDGFARMKMWDRFGYKLLDFPYVQPALSEDQEAVKGLGLMFRPLAEEYRESVPPGLVRDIVADYQIWAMRIPAPEEAKEFREMARYLAGRERVGLLSLGEYACVEEAPPFNAVEIKDGDQKQLGEFAALYVEAFSHDETAVEVSEFGRGSRAETYKGVMSHYWLWGLTAAGESQLRGLASFFSFPHCGFGGYVALAGVLRGKGYFRRFLRLMEKRIVQVNDQAQGWYVECEPDSTEAAIFKKCSFIEVPMTYLQPRLHTDRTGVSDGKRLELLYKPLGRVYGTPLLTLEELQRDLREILTRIYYLDAAGLEKNLGRMTWPAGDPEDVFGAAAKSGGGGELRRRR